MPPETDAQTHQAATHAAGTDAGRRPSDRSSALLTFNSPLSQERAARLIAILRAGRPSTVLDLGCGWGELMLRIAAAMPGIRGTGVDNHRPDVERGRAAAAGRGLADRVTFIEGPATDNLAAADLVLSVGAYHAFGTIAEALGAIRPAVRPGGRLLFAAEFWERTPTEAELAGMWPGMTVGDCTDIAGIVDLAIAAGFRPLRIESVDRGEWEEYESLFTAEREEWLLAHPDHQEADEVRAELAKARGYWLRGHRGLLGFAYVILGVPVAA